MGDKEKGKESVRTLLSCVTVEAVHGDIVNETTDAIVNSTNDEMDFHGEVSTALLIKGGNKIKTDCQKKGKIEGNGVFAASVDGTPLKCKYLFHVNVHKRTVDLVKNCLSEADHLGLHSISFPVLGTGLLHSDPEKIIPSLVSAVQEFLSSFTPSHIRLIRFVVFQKSMMGAFKKALMLVDGSDPRPLDVTTKKRYSAEPISKDSKDYELVKKAFFETAPTSFEIVEIERIQNDYLWRQYQIQKEKILYNMQNKTAPVVERRLWHGTDEVSLRKICKTHFNRSYCGQNATLYGKGVYFAHDSSYSMDDTYSKPNSTGLKHMIYCRVLTGEFVLGNSKMNAPPLREHGNQVNFDSTVDDVTNPRIFVVYHDDQAYPEFVVKFKAQPVGVINVLSQKLQRLVQLLN